MVKVRQGVDDRDGTVGGELIDDVLAEGPHHHRIDIARHDPGHVLQRLGASQLGVAGGQENDLPAEPVHCRLERDPGPGRGFLEDQADRATGQLPVGHPFAAFTLELYRPFDKYASSSLENSSSESKCFAITDTQGSRRRPRSPAAISLHLLTLIFKGEKMYFYMKGRAFAKIFPGNPQAAAGFAPFSGINTQPGDRPARQ